MAVSPWQLYNRARFKIGAGQINLSGPFRIVLFTSASNAPVLTTSLVGSVTGPVASVANAYSLRGKTLTSISWAVSSLSAATYVFRAGNVFWSAFSAIANIKYAVLHVSAATAAGRHVLAVSQLSASAFTIPGANRITLAINAGGIFTVT